MKALLACGALLGVVVLSGCVSRLGDLTVVTTKNVGTNFDISKARPQGEFEATSSKPIFLGIPIGMPNLEDAADLALAAGQGHIMTDVTIHYSWVYVLLFGGHSFTVKGTVWQIPGLPLPAKPKDAESMRTTPEEGGAERSGPRDRRVRDESDYAWPSYSDYN